MPRLSVPLSVTWQVRLLNAALSMAVLVSLILLAQVRIRAVLYDALDRTLTESAREIAARPPRDGSRENRRPFGGGGNPPPPFDGGQGDFDRPPPRDGGEPPRQRDNREPPPMKFGAIALLPFRVLSLDEPGRGQPHSVAGRDAAAKRGFDKRTEADADNGAIRVVSVRGDNRVVQTAGATAPIESTLTEINRALLALLLPLAAVAAVLGAVLTEFALAPVRRLAQAVGHIESDNLSARLPEPGGNDAFDRLAQRLNALLARLDAAFARQKRFTGAASHELRTPLAVIKGSTSLLLENPESLTPLQARSLRRADESADRANRLISDLLTLTRTENGTLPVRLATVNLADLVAETIGDFPVPDVSVIADVPGGLVVRTAPDMVRRLLQNLVSNALRHTAQGSVTVAARTEARTLTLTVRDTGEGIAPADLPRL
ncbi:MAG: HAMP domain-containing histidine kinase, partial [Armatimonadetes bacterium]|nr:HAMP domain-containing histidine kinase [Armatimonadota bacterium]